MDEGEIFYYNDCDMCVVGIKRAKKEIYATVAGNLFSRFLTLCFASLSEEVLRERKRKSVTVLN